MLRGQGSLKELLGQSVVASSYARKKRLKAEADAAAAANAQPTASKRAKPSSSRSAPAGTDAAANAAAKMFAKAKSAVKAEQQQASDLTRVRSDPPDLATPRNLRASLSDAAPDTSTPATSGPSTAMATGRRGSAGGVAAPGSTPICCPLCSRTLSGSSDSAINSHIGEACSGLSHDCMCIGPPVRTVTLCRAGALHLAVNVVLCNTADHCLARSASTKKVKQRTVTALFGSASAAAAQRCKAMLQHKHVQQQAALRSISAPLALQLRRQQQQPRQQLSQDFDLVGSQQDEPDTDMPALQQEPDQQQQGECAAVSPASPGGNATTAAQVPAATGAMPDLLDQATQPLDAMLQLRRQHLATAKAAGRSVDSASAISQDTPATGNDAGAAAARASLTAKPLIDTDAVGADSPTTTATAVTGGGAAAPATGSHDEPGMHTPQRQIISRQAVLPCASPLATVKSFSTCVVGRRFQTEAE